jgi:hypothetical protein
LELLEIPDLPGHPVHRARQVRQVRPVKSVNQAVLASQVKLVQRVTLERPDRVESRAVSEQLELQAEPEQLVQPDQLVPLGKVVSKEQPEHLVTRVMLDHKDPKDNREPLVLSVPLDKVVLREQPALLAPLDPKVRVVRKDP